MTNNNTRDLSQRAKIALRQEILHQRQALTDSEKLDYSVSIWRLLKSLPCWSTAQKKLFYLHVRSEVLTHQWFEEALNPAQAVAVPYCVDSDLNLAWLYSWKELAPGRFGVLEPTAMVRADPARQVRLDWLDVVLVPGVAFDRAGARLGYGKGYYDRFLSRLPPQVPRVGLAYSLQLVPTLPTEPTDQRVDYIVTETGIVDTARAIHEQPGN